MALASVKIDAKDLLQAGRDILGMPQEVAWAVIHAMEKAGRDAYAVVEKTLEEETGIRKADMKRSGGLRVKRPSIQSPTYEIIAKAKHTPLMYFDATQGAAGVSARPWNNMKTFRGTFIATMPSGHTGVFQRDKSKPQRRVHYKSRATGKRTSKVLPIRELWGPNLAVEMMRGKAAEKFEEVVTTQYPKHLEAELLKLDAKWRRKSGG